FVGTKRQAQEPVAEQATRVGMPYVNQRWLGGMLTNFNTISKRLTRLKELEEIDFDTVAGSGYTKKELLILKREKDKLEKTLGGIRSMSKVPSAVWIVDTKKEHLAVDEARKLGLPVIAILDTNCDPDEVDYKIPGNDDAIRSVTLLTRVVADAVAEGLVARSGGSSAGDADEATGEVAEGEPMAEWERELLAGDAAPAEAAEVSTETASSAEPMDSTDAPAITEDAEA
ncbi:MAG: 30S ribosomal protein S2, partial [Nostocoides sp.]